MFVVEYIMSLRLDFAATLNQSMEEEFCSGEFCREELASSALDSAVISDVSCG